MFQPLKSLFRTPKNEPNEEQVAAFELNNKPFARALLLRTAHYQDEASRDLAQSGISAGTKKHASLDEAAASGAVTLAYHVATEALKRSGHEAAFLPLEPIPKHASMVVAFSLMVLANIRAQLTVEGIQLDFSSVATRTASLFFLTHPDDVRIEYATRGIAAFRSVAQADAPNVKEWRDHLGQLVLAYVFEWTDSAKQPEQVDFPAIFGGLLAGFLKAVE
ncbi:MAG: hypothetical protein WD672_00440 [Woeseia sp.]